MWPALRWHDSPTRWRASWALYSWGLGILVAAVSWFQMRLEDRERLEKLELEELARSHGTAALFEAKDAEVFPAQRSREQFERFFVPAFTVLLFLLQGGGAYFLWRWLSRSTTVTAVKEPITGLALFGVFALVLFLLGRFSSTVARIEDRRLLRPGASYLLANAFLCFVVHAGLGRRLGRVSRRRTSTLRMSSAGCWRW